MKKLEEADSSILDEDKIMKFSNPPQMILYNKYSDANCKK